MIFSSFCSSDLSEENDFIIEIIFSRDFSFKETFSISNKYLLHVSFISEGISLFGEFRLLCFIFSKFINKGSPLFSFPELLFFISFTSLVVFFVLSSFLFYL